MFVFYGLNNDAEKVEKATYIPPDKWSGNYHGIKDILDTTEWGRLGFKKFDPNNKEHLDALPDLIGGTYLWCEKRRVVMK